MHRLVRDLDRGLLQLRGQSRVADRVGGVEHLRYRLQLLDAARRIFLSLPPTIIQPLAPLATPADTKVATRVICLGSSWVAMRCCSL